MLGFVLVRIVAACSSATSFAVLLLEFLVVAVALAEIAGPSSSIKNDDDKHDTSVSLHAELDPANGTRSVVMVVDLPAPFPGAGAPERISRSRYDVEVPMLEGEEQEDDEEIPMLEDGGTLDDEPLVEHCVHRAAVVFVDEPTLPRAWQQ